jgi:hypothetical protein
MMQRLTQIQRDNTMFALGQKVTLATDFIYQDGGACATVNIFLPKGKTGTVAECPDGLNDYYIILMDEKWECLQEYDNHVGITPDFLLV